MFLGDFLADLGSAESQKEKVFGMMRKDCKGRTEKRILSKCKDVRGTYDAIQSAYADMLQEDDSIREIQYNILLEDLSEGKYTSDFVCIRPDGDIADVSVKNDVVDIARAAIVLCVTSGRNRHDQVIGTAVEG